MRNASDLVALLLAVQNYTEIPEFLQSLAISTPSYEHFEQWTEQQLAAFVSELPDDSIARLTQVVDKVFALADGLGQRSLSVARDLLGQRLKEEFDSEPSPYYKGVLLLCRAPSIFSEAVDATFSVQHSDMPVYTMYAGPPNARIFGGESISAVKAELCRYFRCSDDQVSFSITEVPDGRLERGLHFIAFDARIFGRQQLSVFYFPKSGFFESYGSSGALRKLLVELVSEHQLGLKPDCLKLVRFDFKKLIRQGSLGSRGENVKSVYVTHVSVKNGELELGVTVDALRSDNIFEAVNSKIGLDLQKNSHLISRLTVTVFLAKCDHWPERRAEIIFRNKYKCEVQVRCCVDRALCRRLIHKWNIPIFNQRSDE